MLLQDICRPRIDHRTAPICPAAPVSRCRMHGSFDTLTPTKQCSMDSDVGTCRLAGGVVEARQALLTRCLADILAAAPPLAAHPALAAFLHPLVRLCCCGLAYLRPLSTNSVHVDDAGPATAWNMRCLG